jgi:hypothetical protein
MQEEVGGTTTAGEWVWGSFGDGRANFSMSLMPVASGKAAVDGWAGEARSVTPLNV